MEYLTIVLSLVSLRACGVYSVCRSNEYETGDGPCCRYPDPGKYVTRNCTLTEGIQIRECTSCLNHTIVANCTHFSDTKCEMRGTPPPTPSFYLAVMVPPMVIGLIFSAILIYRLYIQPHSRSSPSKPYLPHCLLAYLKADKNSEADV